MNIFTKEVYVFTPKGEIRKIPSGATVIDFAYEIHTEVGNKAIAAKVNHQLKPLSHVLKWRPAEIQLPTNNSKRMAIAITTKAKNRIKSSLKEDRRYHIDKGQEIFIKKVRELNLKLDHKRFKELRKTYNTPHKEDFYFKIGSGLIQIDDLEKQAAKTFKTFASYWKLSIPKFRTSQPKSKKNTLIIDDNADTKRITLAKCCNPIPGDEVAGFVNPNESIIIHKRICERLTNLAATQGDRIISVKWTSYKLQSLKQKFRLKVWIN